ncbi:MAG: quinone-dependent dihydroorotate dehydrogenase [Gammaproteobacteria bacterium]|nr:quinone-dependent dihydroorotate dehydrogenase [Gammaproteobacteria bacterium]
MYELLRESLFTLDAERAHDLTLGSLRGLDCARVSGALFGRPPRLERTLFGLTFRNPVGLAAGLDKDGVAIAGLAALGFGFIEVGTVTPKPQAGSEKPRLFRLRKDRALINRMGFNNLGVDHLARRIDNVRSRVADDCPIGVNIGKNKDTPNEQAHQDYVVCARRVAEVADYITLNLSSPNTPGLRDLARVESIAPLLDAVKRCVDSTPLLVKISPDMADDDLDALAAGLRAWGADGVIATNTTISRPASLASREQAQPGGLSGAPLFERSLRTVSQIAPRLSGLPLIGCGGVHTAADARQMVEAGASLVQIYTGLIYEGPRLIHSIVEALRQMRFPQPTT